MNEKTLNLFNQIDRIDFFNKNDIEMIFFVDKADEGIIIIKAKKDKFSDIEEFVLRAYIKNDLEELKSVNKIKRLDLINNDFLLESDKCIHLNEITKDEIYNSFIIKTLKNLDIKTDIIQSIFWIENNYMYQSILLSTKKYLYYIERSLG